MRGRMHGLGRGDNMDYIQQRGDQTSYVRQHSYHFSRSISTSSNSSLIYPSHSNYALLSQVRSYPTYYSGTLVQSLVLSMTFLYLFFFFKQKTAYEMPK